MLKNYIFLFVVGATLSCESSNTNEHEPSKIVQTPVVVIDNRSEVALEGLNDYIDFINKNYANCLNCSVVEMIEKHELFTSHFKNEHTQLIEKSFVDAPDYGLGFDPIVDGQDCPTEGFVVKSIDGNYITLKGVDWPEFELTVKMKQEGEKWLIDGVGIINIPEQKRAKR